MTELSILGDGKYSIRDLVDIERLRGIFEEFSQTTGFTTGLVSYPEQEVLIATGWRDICAKFHRTCPESAIHCKNSNVYLTRPLKDMKQLNMRTCENGFVDGATPIVIKGRHVANLFSGQILFEKPDAERFKKQAEIYGFDSEKYQNALSEVPIVTEDELKKALSFLSSIATMIVEQGAKNLDVLESKRALQEEISDRKKLEEELGESEAKYRKLLDLSPDPIAILQNNRHVFINQAHTELFEYTVQDVEKGLSPLQLVPEKGHEIVLSRMSERFAGGEPDPKIIGMDLVSKGGKLIPCEITGRLIEYDGQPADLTIIRDNTERKRAEEALGESEERFRSLVELTSDWIWEVDQNGIFTYVDPKVKDFLGYEPEDVVGKPFHSFMTEDSKRLASSFKDQSEKTKPFSRSNSVQLHKDGRQIIIEASGLPIFDIDGKLVGWRGIDTDITERVRIEEMMIQAEKMLSVGGLAAGMAHEINNPLAGIMQNVQVMKNRMSGELSKNIAVAEECGTSIETIETYMEKRGMFEMFKSVMESGKRAAKIVNNMLSFSRKSDESFAPHSLSDLFDKTIELAENDYDLKQKFDFRQIEIVREYGRSMSKVTCEGSKIQQVILNILKNGAQAMAKGKGRTSDDRQLKAEGEPEISDSRFTLRVMPDGEMARIEIEDNGPGMEEETRKRIFEPFFTTKGVGIGTGLGLSVSYFIITENHRGTMEVESAPGKGAKFIIHLPFERNALINTLY